MPPGDWTDFLAPPVPDNVLEVLEELNLDIVRVDDAEVWARCPQHAARTGKADRRASFSVHQEKGVFNCFSCGYKGSLVDLVADTLRVEYGQATTWLNGKSGLAAAARRLEARHIDVPTRRPASGLEADYVTFAYPPDAELDHRKISLDAAVRFGIRWNEDGWVLPIRDPLTYQLLGWQTKHGSKVRNNPPGVKKSETLFGLSAFEGDWVYLVESPLDCARLWTAGFPGAVASFGAIVSNAQIDLLVRTANTVVIALDNDAAGWASAPEVERRLAGRVQILRFTYPEGAKDPGDMSDQQILTSAIGVHSPLWFRFAKEH